MGRIQKMLLFSSVQFFMTAPAHGQNANFEALKKCVTGLNVQGNKFRISNARPVTEVVGQGQLPNQHFNLVVGTVKENGKNHAVILSPQSSYMLTDPLDSNGQPFAFSSVWSEKCTRLLNQNKSCDKTPLTLQISTSQEASSIQVITDPKEIKSASSDPNFSTLNAPNIVRVTAQILSEQLKKLDKKLKAEKKFPLDAKQFPDLSAALPHCYQFVRQSETALKEMNTDELGRDAAIAKASLSITSSDLNAVMAHFPVVVTDSPKLDPSKKGKADR